MDGLDSGAVARTATSPTTVIGEAAVIGPPKHDDGSQPLGVTVSSALDKI